MIDSSQRTANCADSIKKIFGSPSDVLDDFLIGNNDAHGKNFSFRYETPKETKETGSGAARARPAPLYDLVSTALYPELSPKMAMKVGSKYLPEKVRLRHRQTLWHDARLSENAARKRTIQFARKVRRILNNTPAENEVQKAIADAVGSRVQRIATALAAS